MTGVSERSQQSSNLKDEGYNSTRFKLLVSLIVLMRVKSFAD
ncbi:hypothetical protein ACK3F5_01305 [Photorhabdus asymbiotica UENP]